MINKFFNKIPFFIAEISGNHNGKIENARKLIDLAIKGGADAVKLQTYTPDMMTLKKNKYKIQNGLWAKKNLWYLYKKAHTPLKWHKPLYLYAKKRNIKIFSTPFSTEGVDFLEKLKNPIYKVSSFEMNDLNLIKKIALTKKPMIISTGLASFNEIKKTVHIAKKHGCSDLTLLYCVSNYPSKESDFNLNNIEILKKKFKCRVGLSDHSLGSSIASFSICKGAEIIEKHICLKSVKSVDSKFSLKGNEVSKFRKDINQTYQLVKNVNFVRSKDEIKNKIFRRSIYATMDIKKGEKFLTSNIKTLRPNLGLDANYYLYLINKKSPVNLKKDEPLNKNLLKILQKKTQHN